MYEVVGGEYTNTEFDATVGPEERHGPMSWEEAVEMWKGLSMKHVDHCMTRYRIEPVAKSNAA